MRKIIILTITITILLTPHVYAQGTSIQPRAGHRMIYSPEKDLVIMFGGMNLNTASYYNDLWKYNPRENQWTMITVENSPSPRGAPGFAYNPDRRECLLFGGLQTSRLGDTWIFSLETMKWTKQSTKASPSARSDTGLVYDPATKLYILYGGYGTGLQSDTWAYDSEENNWIKIETLHNPGMIYGQSMMWSPSLGRIIMYGGHLGSPTSDSYLNDVWSFNSDKQDWEIMKPVNEVQGRYWAAADVTETGLIVCFGGGSGSLGDTVIIDIASDRPSVSSVDKPSPSPRFFSQLCYIGENRFILYGGCTSEEVYGDMWLFGVDSGWVSLEPIIGIQEENGVNWVFASAVVIILGLTLVVIKKYGKLFTRAT